MSSFSTLEVSSFSALNITGGYITSGLVSSVIGDFEDIGCSSISTLGIILDGNILTSVGAELLLNGVPIATTSNISSLADWSYDPAISTLNMNGNSSINGTLLSTTTINAGSAFITNLVCNDISTFTLTAQSTIHSISTISSFEVEAQIAFFSSINGAQFPAASVSSFGTASVSSLSVSSINNVAYPPPSVDLSQWATLPAVSNVNVSTHSLNFKPFTGAGGLVTGYTTSIFDTNIQMGNTSTIILPSFNGFVSQFNVGSIVSPAGSATFITSGSIGLNSATGVNILGVGGCSVTGVGGVSIAGGGGLSILGGGAVLVDGGNVTINGAGLVSIEALGGLAVGAGGVAVTGGVVAITGASGVLMTGGGGISIAGGGGVVVAAGGSVLSPAATISSLNVSSVNGVAYPPTTAVPADLVVSTLNAVQTITTSSIGTNTATANDLNTTRLTINGAQQNPGIVLQANGSAPSYSSEIYFSQGIPGNSTIGLFMTSITPSSQAITTQYHSTAFSAGGGVGNIAVDKLFLSQNGTTWANLQADPAASSIIVSVPMSISSIINVSTINGVAYPPASSGGIQSTIANAGSFVNIDGTGTISISTSLTPAGTHNLNVDVDNNITLQVENGGIYLDNNNAVSHVHLTGNGDVDIFAAGNNSINLDYNGGITITAAVPGSVNIINLSTINGAPYPPVAPAVSSITNGGGFINIDAAGAISTATAAAVGYSVVSNNAMTFNATQNGILLQDTDFGASLRVYNGITIGAGTSSFVIGSVPTSVSSLVDVSSINGIIYPPPSSGGSPNGQFSTIVVQSYVNAPDIVAVSSLTIGNPSTTEASYIYPRGSGTGDIIITPGTYLGTSGSISLQDPLGGFGKLQVGQITQLSSIYGIGSVFITSATSSLSVSSINGLQFPYTASTISTFNTASISSLSVSTINGLPPPVSSFGTASVSSLSVSSINGSQIQGPVWVAGGVDTIITTNISTPNVYIPINAGVSSVSTTGTAKFFITGQACYTAPAGVNTIASWTIARSSTYPPTAVSSVNLASGGGFISANSISNNAYRLSGVLTPATYTSATPFSIVDTPPAGAYWYSLWAAGTTTTPISTENVTMTILRVAP